MIRRGVMWLVLSVLVLVPLAGASAWLLKEGEWSNPSSTLVLALVSAVLLGHLAVSLVHPWLGRKLGIPGADPRWDLVEQQAEYRQKVADLEYRSRKKSERLRALNDSQEARVKDRTRPLEELIQELAEANEALKAHDQLKSRFFANISHELRTPLTLILAPLEGMLLEEREPLSEDQQRQFTLIRRNAMRLLKLINNLLELAQLEEGGLSLETELVDLVGFAAQLTGAAHPLAKKRDIEIIFEPSARPVIRADPEKLERVIINLLSNALKFTDSGGYVVVLVGITGDRAWVSVQDSGIGIPPEELDRIFDRFRQVDASTTRRHGGTGIGLSLVKELVEQHGGKITVSSQPGKGSTFTANFKRLPDNEAEEVVGLASVDSNEVFSTSTTKPENGDPFSRLLRGQIEFRHQEVLATTEAVELEEVFGGYTPTGATRLTKDGVEDRRHRADRALATDLQAATPMHELPAARPGAPRPTVLVVEDSADMRRVLGDALSRRFRVISANNGEEGLARAREELPALVLCDLMMPVMDGVALCEALRADRTTAPIPVIMITARVGTEESVKALDAGADDFLCKPFSLRELHARVGAQLRIRQLDQAVARAERMATLGTTAAGLAHEVRNALNPIIGGINAMDRLKPGKDRADLREQMKRSAQRILDTIEALQAFARMGDARLICLDMTRAVNETLKLLSHRLRGVQVTCDLGLEEEVECYAGTMHQVLMNLVINAADAAGDGGRVWIGTSQEGDNALVRVRDSGPGILATERERIFYPYFTTKPVGQGTGLGLSIARSMVERHGGTLEVTSPPDKGAEFTVTMPLKLQEKIAASKDEVVA